MSIHSAGWQDMTTGELCEYITSGSRDWKSYYSNKGSLFVRTQDISHDYLDLEGVAHVSLPEKVEGKRSLLKPGDLLIAITGYTGRVALVPEEIPEGYVSQSVGLMRLKDPRNAPYLHYYLQSEAHGRKYVKKVTYGIGRPVLNLQNLRNIPVQLPSLPQQRKIVADIEKQFTRLDTAIVALKSTQARLKRYRAAVLNAACEGRLVPTEAELAKKEGRSYEPASVLIERILKELRARTGIKYKESTVPNVKEFPTLPDGWAWATFEQISERVTVGFVGPMKHEYVKSGVPFLRGQNVRENRFDSEGLLYVSREFHAKLSKSTIHPGDLAVVR
jgi:type I restriction enzyme, S subunit